MKIKQFFLLVFTAEQGAKISIFSLFLNLSETFEVPSKGVMDRLAK